MHFVRRRWWRKKIVANSDDSLAVENQSIALEAWRERVAIVRFCSGVELTDRQAQRIVQRQIGLSDDAAREMAETDQRAMISARSFAARRNDAA